MVSPQHPWLEHTHTYRNTRKWVHMLFRVWYGATIALSLPLYMMLAIYRMGARNLKRSALFISCLLFFFLHLCVQDNKIVEINTLYACVYVFISSCCQWLRCDEIAKSDIHTKTRFVSPGFDWMAKETKLKQEGAEKQRVCIDSVYMEPYREDITYMAIHAVFIYAMWFSDNFPRSFVFR